MTEKTVQDLLKATFPKTDKADWTSAAAIEIKKDNVIESLTWLTQDKLPFKPIYDKNDITELKYLNAFNLSPSTGFQGARSWSNLPLVTVIDELTANKTALEHLSNGADGILFNLTKEGTSLSLLLDKIEWPYCNISFIGELSSLKKNIVEQVDKFESKKLQGIIWDPEPKHTIVQKLSECNIQASGIIVFATTPVEEIVQALFAGVNQIEALTSKEVDVQRAIKSIAFSLPVHAEFFIEVAKLKTLRMLWFQIVSAYGISTYQPDALHIHARIESTFDEKFQPHGNLLKGTLGTMAAVLGGCNSLTVYPESENSTMMNRIARNVSNILREESHFDKVADAIAGAYAIENMINELSEKAWNKFTSKSL